MHETQQRSRVWFHASRYIEQHNKSSLFFAWFAPQQLYWFATMRNGSAHGSPKVVA
jgi:hypothetical protein